MRWLLLVACSAKESGETSTETDPTPTIVTWPAPVVTISEPTQGSEVDGPDLGIGVTLEGFTLSEVPLSARSHRPEPGRAAAGPPGAAAHTVSAPPHGLVVWSVDGEEVDRTATDRYTVVGVTPGAHAVSVELVYPDGDAFYPPVEDEVDVKVR